MRKRLSAIIMAIVMSISVFPKTAQTVLADGERSESICGEWYHYEEIEGYVEVLVGILRFYEDGSMIIDYGFAESEVVSRYEGEWSVMQASGRRYIMQIDGELSIFDEYEVSETERISAEILIEIDGNQMQVIQGNEAIYGLMEETYTKDMMLDEWRNGGAEEPEETEETEDDIVSTVGDALNDAGIFAWNWFWDTTAVDREDCIMGEWKGYPWEYYAVTEEGIQSLEDLRTLSNQYFTAELTEDLLDQKLWIEQDGKLYVSAPEGLGGPGISEIYLKVNPISEDKYEVLVFEYWDYMDYDEMKDNPKIIYYQKINGHWVLDDITPLYSQVPVYEYKEDEGLEYIAAKEASYGMLRAGAIALQSKDIMDVGYYDFIVNESYKEIVRFVLQQDQMSEDLYSGIEAYNFAVQDLNADGVDELVVSPQAEWGYGYDFIFSKDEQGYTTYIGHVYSRGSITYSRESNTIEYLISIWEGEEEYGYFQIQNGRMLRKSEIVTDDTDQMLNWMSEEEILKYLSSENTEEDFSNVSAEQQWIQQYKEYIESKDYRDQITKSYTGELLSIMEESSVAEEYDMGPALNQYMGIQLNDKVQEYELLLAQLLYNPVGKEMLHTMYVQCYQNAFIDMIRWIMENKNMPQETYQKLENQISEMHRVPGLVNEVRNSVSDIMNTVKDAEDIGFTINDVRKMSDNGFRFLSDWVEKDTDSLPDSMGFIIQYAAMGEAYYKTSDMLSDMLLRLRRHMDIESEVKDFQPTQNPVTYDELVNIMKLDPENKKTSDIVENTISMKSMVSIIEEYYTNLKDHKYENSLSMIQQIMDQKDTDIENELVHMLIHEIPVIQQDDILQEIYNSDSMSRNPYAGIEDPKYHSTMLKRLSCVQYIFCDAMDDYAYEAEWKNEDVQKINNAVQFYKSIQNVALDHAVAYEKNIAGKVQSEISYGILKLEEQRREIEEIADFVSKAINVQKRHLDKTLEGQIITVMGPVDLIITDASGKEIAVLSNNEIRIEEGYENYYALIEKHYNTSDYMKVAFVPEQFTVELRVHDDGVMDAYIADYVDGEIKNEIDFLDIPVESGTEGKFVLDGEWYLVLDGQALDSKADVKDTKITLFLYLWIGVAATTILGAAGVTAWVFINKKKKRDIIRK